MLLIPVALYDCTAANILTRRRPYRMSIEWVDLFWAAVTVGRRNRFDVLRFGFASQMEITSRIATLLANLEERPVSAASSGLFKTQAFDALDGSEKGAVTYSVGLVLAKLHAEALGVDWLMHLDVYTRPNSPHGVTIPVQLLPGRRRPDLIGESVSGDWLVIESKGRSHGVSNDLRIEAKEQTRRISQVNGRLPQWRYAVIARFRHGQLAVDMVDPVDPFPDAPSFDIDPDVFAAEYYQLVKQLLVDSRNSLRRVTVRGQRFAIARIDSLDVEIGLRADLFLQLRRADRTLAPQPIRLHAILRRLTEGTDPVREGRLRIGKDGVFVKLGRSWKSKAGAKAN
jgi:hypothetical protein